MQRQQWEREVRSGGAALRPAGGGAGPLHRTCEELWGDLSEEEARSPAERSREEQGGGCQATAGLTGSEPSAGVRAGDPSLCRGGCGGWAAGRRPLRRRRRRRVRQRRWRERRVLFSPVDRRRARGAAAARGAVAATGGSRAAIAPAAAAVGRGAAAAASGRRGRLCSLQRRDGRGGGSEVRDLAESSPRSSRDLAEI